jgi:hypothetical protein
MQLPAASGTFSQVSVIYGPADGFLPAESGVKQATEGAKMQRWDVEISVGSPTSRSCGRGMFPPWGLKYHWLVPHAWSDSPEPRGTRPSATAQSVEAVEALASQIVPPASDSNFQPMAGSGPSRKPLRPCAGH